MVPFIAIGIRLLFLLTVFTYDTPAYYTSQGETELVLYLILTKFLGKKSLGQNLC